ncbi:MAG: outer membrane protein assembly factor [Balneolaceae bacterium]
MNDFQTENVFPNFNPFFSFVVLILVQFLFFPLQTGAQDSERSDIIWKVKFEGNETFSDMLLHNIIAADSPNFFQKTFGKTSRFELIEDEIRRDVIRIQRYYQRRGFSNIAVDYAIEELRKKWKKKVIFTVREGSPIRIRNTSVDIDADSSDIAHIRNSREFQRALVNHDFVQGNRYQSIRTPDAEGVFEEVMQNLGYAFAEAEVEAVIDTAAHAADIVIINRPGPRTRIDEFIVEGDITVPKRIVTRETGIQIGDLYSRRSIQEAQRQIFNHHLFRFATIGIPEQPRDTSLTMLLRVREYPPRSVQTSIGIGREEIVRGQVSWQHRNISGTGHRFSSTSRGSFIEQRVNADYLIPFVFNTKSSYVASIFGQRRLEPSFELLRTGITNSLIYQPRRNLTGSFSYEFSINKETSRRERRTALPDTVLNFDVSSLSFSGFYSQGLSREQRGWVVQPSLEISGTFGEATFRFQKFALDVRRFTELSGSTVLATRINSGAIFFTQNDSLPSTIRFFTGGTNTVRGWTRQDLGPKVETFNEDGTFNRFIPIGGRVLLNFNLEIRQQFDSFIDGFGIAAFLDGGQVWRNFDRLNERSIQFGTGGGFRYQSPIGPVRIDLGYKVNPTQQDLDIFDGQDFGNIWNKINIHFSIGQAF